MRIVWLFLFSIFIVMPIAQAAYYADIDITLDTDGSIFITGDTNHPLLEDSVEFTSKQGKYWILNMTIPGTFSDYIYRLHMPSGSSVNYIKTANLARIEQDSTMTIIGTGENDPFLLVVQYSINKEKAKLLTYITVLAGVIILFTVFFIMVKLKKKKKAYNPQALSSRQRQIIKHIEKKGQITQAEIEKMTNMPKSSLSRNIDSLVRKGLIKKEEKGMSNLLTLK